MKKNSKILTALLASFFLFSAGAVFSQDAGAEKAKPATEFNPYMKVFLFMDVKHDSDDFPTTGGDTEYSQWLSSISRFGGNFKYGKLSANTEIGLNTGGVNLRRAFVEYSFDGGSVLFGREWSPYGYFTEQTTRDLIGSWGFGSSSDMRKTRLLTRFMGAYLDLVEPENDMKNNAGNAIAAEADSIMPKIAVGYDFSAAGFKISPAFIMNYTRLSGKSINTDTTDDIEDHSWDLDGEAIFSWMACLHMEYSVDIFTVRMNGAYGVNPGNMGFEYPGSVDASTVVLPARAEVNSDKDGIENTKVMEGFIDFGIKLDFGTINAGCGYAQADAKSYGVDKQIQYYGNVQIPVHEMITVTPEFSYHDFLNDDGYEWVASLLVMAYVK